MSNLKRFLSKATALSRSTLSVVLVLCLLMLMIPTVLLVAADDAWDGTTKTPYTGTGSVDDPYLIENGEHLAYMAQQVNAGTDKSKYFELAADINLNNKAWTAIGDATHKFSGTLDGKGHAITGLNVSGGAASGVGLFGRTGAGALIKNVSLQGASTINQNNCVGGFVGYVTGNLTISDCTFTGTVDGYPTSDTAYVGGFIGYAWGNYTIELNNCHAVNATITAHKGSTTQHGTGGLVGIVGNGADLTITNSSFSGTVSGGNANGGLVGAVYYGAVGNLTDVVIKKSYSAGTITGTSTTGGLVGYLRADQSTDRKTKVTIEDSYSVATMPTTVTSSGLVGGNYGWKDYPDKNTVIIKDSFFAGTAKFPILNSSHPNGHSGTQYNNLKMNVTLNNVYYREGSYTTPTTSVDDLTPEATFKKTAADFAAGGTVLGLLNGGRNFWVQGANYPIIPKNPKMTDLEIDNGNLVFDAAVTEYDVSLDNTVTALAVTPTVEDGTAVTVNGEPATSGTAKSVNLTANDTTVIKVTISRDGIEKTYTINAACADIWDGTTATAYPNADAEGAGTAANPYEISSPEHLAYLAQQVNAGTNYAGKYFKLMNNINLGDQNWTRIGGNFAGTNRNFNGTFDGNGKTISGLKIREGAVTHVGLFGRTGSGAVIKNLALKGDIKSEGTTIGAFVGEAAGNLTISKCTFSGSVQGQGISADIAAVGGFVGYIWGDYTVKIEDSTVVNASLTALRGGSSYAVQGTGGLVGVIGRGADLFITNTSFDGTINAEKGNGGMVGVLYYGQPGDPTVANIDHCYTAGTYTGNGTVGGLVGYLRVDRGNANKAEVHVNNSYSVATMQTSLTSSGLVGCNYAWNDAPANCSVEIKNSFFAGTAKYPIVHRSTSAGSDAGDMVVTVDNVYYLTGSATATSDLTSAASCEKDATAFSDGTVRDLLNGATGDAWGQGTNPILLPVLKLNNIKLSKGSLEFVPLDFEYQVYLSNTVDSITVTPVSDDSLLNITVNDTLVPSGEASSAINLVDNDTVVIKVKIARDGAEKTYTIRVTCVDGWDGSSVMPFPNIDEENAGTAENPYLISIPEHLAFLQKLAKDGTYTKGNTSDGVLSTTTVVVGDETYTVSYPVTALGSLYGVHFKITADLNLNNKSWNFAEFKGHLDGGNHTIKGLTATSGLITKLSYGSVSNLNVIGTVSGGTAANVGGLVGSMEGGADLTNCSFTGTVSGGTNVGGLVGRTSPYDGSGAIFDIKACWTSGTVSGTGAGIGGLVGNSLVSDKYGGVLNLTDCYSAMTVSTSAASVDKMAGLIGAGNVIYRNCVFVGNVASAYPIGFQASSSVGSTYYKDGSANTTTSANAGFVGGTKKSAADLNDNALVAVLNTYAAPGVVWAKGAEYPVFTYTDPGDVAASADPFYMTGLAVEYAAFDFYPSTFSYSLSIPYSAEKLSMLPTAPANLTITIDGQTVKTDELSQAISLEVGVEKTVIIKVSLGDSYTNYEVKLTRRAQPADGVWDGALEPFDSKNKKGSTIDDPIIIDTPGKLAYLAAMTNGQDVMLGGKVYKAPMTSAGKLYRNVYFEITADLKMNDVTDYEKWGTKESENGPTIVPANDFTPIGFHSDTVTESRSFAGIVNGNDHKIIGLYVSGKNSTGAGGTGLFGCVESGTLRNIHVEKSYVTGAQRVGGIVGRPRTDILMQNCSFSGTVYGSFVHKDQSTQAGGLIGDAVARVKLNSCWSEGTVTGGNALGGLIGQLYMQTGAEIKNCYSVATIVPLQHGDVLCDKNVGGLIGVLSGKAGTVEVYRSHFAGSVPTNTPFIGGKSESSGAVVAASDTVYYREGSYVGEVNSTYTYDAVQKSAKEFSDGTVTDLLNNLVEYGDYWNWKTDEKGYPVSDGILLVTDYRDHTSDEFYDDGDWYKVFENKPGGTLKDPGSSKGDSNDSDDYFNSDTGETSLFSAVLILAMISAISALLLARRKRSVN